MYSGSTQTGNELSISIIRSMDTHWKQKLGSYHLTLRKHIDDTVNKVDTTLAFVRRNLSNCSDSVKTAAYTTMIRPRLDHNKKIHSLEQVQRRAARFVYRSYTECTPGCVSNMVQNLGWETFNIREILTG